MTIKKIYKDDFDKFMENNIDINQYIQVDDEEQKVYFNKNKFLEDTLECIRIEYSLDNDHYYEIVEDNNE